MVTPWWVTATIGLVTAAVTIAGVIVSSSRELKGLRERIDADGGAARAAVRGVDRSEWFRRVQWAHGLLQRDETQIAGFDVLRALADQADDDDTELIGALVRSSVPAEEAAAPAQKQMFTMPRREQAVDATTQPPDTGSMADDGRHDG